MVNLEEYCEPNCIDFPEAIILNYFDEKLPSMQISRIHLLSLNIVFSSAKQKETNDYVFTNLFPHFFKNKHRPCKNVSKPKDISIPLPHFLHVNHEHFHCFSHLCCRPHYGTTYSECSSFFSPDFFNFLDFYPLQSKHQSTKELCSTGKFVPTPSIFMCYMPTALCFSFC